MKKKRNIDLHESVQLGKKMPTRFKMAIVYLKLEEF